MISIFIIAITAAAASLLTFISGFGLATILTPVMSVFFPVEEAIAITGIVHLLNNFFKIILVYKHINWKTGLKFGLTAVCGAYAGAKLLLLLSASQPLYTYQIYDKTFFVTLIKVIMAVLMIIFALFEIIPSLKNIKFKENKLYTGGFISGFFGGLSGFQGALRSAFLLRYNLSKEGFIATGILIACMIDVTRLSVYFSQAGNFDIQNNSGLILTAVLASFGGAYFGNMLLKKITFAFVQNIIAVMIIVLALLLAGGIL